MVATNDRTVTVSGGTGFRLNPIPFAVWHAFVWASARVKEAIEQKRGSSPHDVNGWRMRTPERQRAFRCQRMHDHRPV